jgi:hypothetical protein
MPLTPLREPLSNHAPVHVAAGLRGKRDTLSERALHPQSKMLAMALRPPSRHSLPGYRQPQRGSIHSIIPTGNHKSY